MAKIMNSIPMNDCQHTSFETRRDIGFDISYYEEKQHVDICTDCKAKRFWSDVYGVYDEEWKTHYGKWEENIPTSFWNWEWV